MFQQPKTVKVTIDKNGEVVISVQNAAGGECQRLTAGLENALGIVQSSVPTDEAWLPEQTQEQTLGELQHN